MDFGKMQITNLAQYFATQWTRTPKKVWEDSACQIWLDPAVAF